VPVQLVTTDDKFFTADLLRQEATRFRDAAHRHIAGAGHWPQLEQPALLAKTIEDFVERVAPAVNASGG
jgi:pimeloyl-ACP methyl ester carboxylesterase